MGWLRIEGTKLDYPVMQSSVDNANYYLYRNYNGENSTRGSIYAREECDIFAPSDNITMYGHNMKDGTMFAALNAYTDKTAWENNSLIFFDTFDHTTGEVQYHVYKIFAVYKMIFLSTCEYTLDNGRLVVAAVRIS